jgi:hypothetical protein
LTHVVADALSMLIWFAAGAMAGADAVQRWQRKNRA